MQTLYLIRGLPGSGKTTMAMDLYHTFTNAKLLVRQTSADFHMFALTHGSFNPAMLPQAHKLCQQDVSLALQDNFDVVIVHNTFTTEAELKPYFDMAVKFGCKVVSLVVENRHGNKSVHNVPDATIERMEKRFSIKLK